ncbi:MAG TPA: A/G-specific adenine glycosylase [Kiritimatiellia bacterium]|nr:A/G-specific adenine glycosylase [Kiritimatiellia bacterium]HPK38116.1 A/G-specific adenine glycosylase [Kiritimatiellia bacterium]HRU20468.1 A/G-specific adenine glycosylase [Kiritimatiellia bacterium]
MPPSLTERLLSWYRINRREMPWRDHPDPYAVWVSEIMLQQTRVDTVRGYFVRFLEAFPTVRTLAEAPEQAVLKKWEGLGYYSRARNLRRAAQILMEQGGAWPRSAEAWATLPGVGPYTAAAIASICFGACEPVVDGNVIRVFARYLGWEDDFRTRLSREKLAAWLRPHVMRSPAPGDFNQAMMDLGATVCTPRIPTCAVCPLRRSCQARREGRQTAYPVKPKSQAIPVRHSIAARVRDARGRVLFTQRVDEGLLKGLWELPSVEVTNSATGRDAQRALRRLTGLRAARVRCVGTIRHAFSHFRLVMRVYELTEISGLLDTGRQPPARFAQPARLPLTTATRRALTL